jgi:hypothetical protein
MKKTWITATALVLLFACLPILAQTSSQAPVTSKALARMILAQPGATASCAAQPSRVLLAARIGGTKSLCSATAYCYPGSVTCHDYTNPANCTAVDRSCPEEQGHVTCNGVTTWCPTACPCDSGGPQEMACCRCAQTSDCWDCMFCALGYFIPDGC